MRMFKTSIPDLKVVVSEQYNDERGAFSRFFCKQELTDLVGTRQIVQINFSQTKSIGAIRGFHFQRPPYAEMKLVRCTKGKVWDAVIDLRAHSPTYLQWHSEELTPNNGRMLVIPEGFAHGFQVIEPNSELLYFHTNFYKPEFEDGVRYDDIRIGVKWPLSVTSLSTRDANLPIINDSFKGVYL